MVNSIMRFVEDLLHSSLHDRFATNAQQIALLRNILACQGIEQHLVQSATNWIHDL